MPFKFCGFADEAGKTLAEQIAVTKELGWTGLEIRLLEGKNFCDLDDDTFYAAYDTINANGIKVVGFGSQIANWSRPITTDFQKDVDELKRNIPRMNRVGAKLIRVMSYPNAKETPWAEWDWKKEVFRRLQKLAKIAEDGGVILAHENCNGYGGIGPKQALELVAEINSPAFKLIIDTGNTTLHDQSQEATWEYYRQTIEHTIHVHVKAAKAGPDGKFATCYPDEDPVQARIFGDLKKRGYDGWLSIEPHLAAAVHAGQDVVDPKKNAAIFVDYGRRLMKLVQAL